MGQPIVKRVKILDIMSIMVSQLNLGIKYIDIKIDAEKNTLILRASPQPEEKPNEDDGISLIETL